MLRPLATVLSLLALTVGAMAQSSSDKASNGEFTGIAVLTDDAKWYEQFDRPEMPQISGIDRVAAGERGTVALLFSNAEPRDGMVHIRCDVTAFDPSGTRKVLVAGLCYEGRFGGPNILHPAALDLSFGIGKDEAEGKAGFTVTMHDMHSGRSLDLTVAFTQGGAP